MRAFDENLKRRELLVRCQTEKLVRIPIHWEGRGWKVFHYRIFNNVLVFSDDAQ